MAAGVKEYWIIDRFRRIMTVYRKGLGGPTYEIVTETQCYQTALLPGFVLPLSRLLGKADDGTALDDEGEAARPRLPRPREERNEPAHASHSLGAASASARRESR